jgi:hypothetical protein
MIFSEELVSSHPAISSKWPFSLRGQKTNYRKYLINEKSIDACNCNQVLGNLYLKGV